MSFFDPWTSAKDAFSETLSGFVERTDQFMEKHEIEHRQFGDSNNTNNSESQNDAGVDYNSIAHVYTSFEIGYKYSIGLSGLLGWIKEFTSDDTEISDSLQDQYNNEVGKAVAEYAREHGLDRDEAESVLASAIVAGCVASFEIDPRTVSSDMAEAAAECVSEVVRSIREISNSSRSGGDGHSERGVESVEIGEPSYEAESSPSSDAGGSSGSNHHHDDDNYDWNSNNWDNDDQNQF
jgi:hypothetical protein